MPFTVDKFEVVDVRANDIMGCSESTRACLKFTIVFLNIPIILVGAVSLGIGIWVIVDDTSFFDLTADILDLDVLGQDILRQGGIVMVTAGAAMLVLAGLGVIGALAMCSCVLVFYVLIMVILLTLEAAVIVLAVVFKSEWESKSSKILTDRFVTHYGDAIDDSRGPFTRTFNRLQQKLDCCGWEGSMDYMKVDRKHWNTTMANGQQRQVPDSCCMSDNATYVMECVVNPYNSSSFSSEGCRDAIADEFEIYQWVVIGVAIGVLAFQFLLIILTLVLIVHNVNNKYDMS